MVRQPLWFCAAAVTPLRSKLRGTFTSFPGITDVVSWHRVAVKWAAITAVYRGLITPLTNMVLAALLTPSILER